MRVRVLLFASLRERSGEASVELELEDGATLAELKEAMLARFPAIEGIPYAFAVDREYATEERRLEGGEEIALVPAISGGSGAARVRFSLTEGPIDPRRLEDEARTDEDGAIVSFLGVTRNHHDGARVERLAYECYEEMATAKMHALMQELLEEFEVTRIRCEHRLGEVPIGEASVAIVVSAAHRGPAYACSERLMDRLKKEVPIFKKEILVDGEARWIGELPDAR